MPSSSAQSAASERLNDRTQIPHEPPKLKTTLKTPPKQATNPLQFVKVGPCSLYRTAQEQLQKVQEVKKIKQEIRDDPEDWQSNLDNWKSSRRKRQEHIIERVVEVKKLEQEDHERQRRRSKTFSEMMEERGNRGRKLSISLAVYNEEDANDLSDLGIGTSSGKSSVSGDTHDDTHSVLSDRDSEIEKNHSDVDNASHENGNDNGAGNAITSSASSSMTSSSSSPLTTGTTIATTPSPAVAAAPTTTSFLKKEILNNGLHKNGASQQEYDSATTATASSPEPEEYTYEGAIRGYVSRVSQNIPRRSLADLDAKFDNKSSPEDKSSAAAVPVVKVDILKRREIFEKASLENKNSLNNNNNSSSSSNNNNNNNSNNNNRLDFGSGKSIKERLSILEKQKAESEAHEKMSKSPRHSMDNGSSVRERFKLNAESKEVKTRDLLAEELEAVKPLRERLSNLEKFAAGEQQRLADVSSSQQHNNGELSAKSIKERLISLDANRAKDTDKRPANCFHEQQSNSRVENSTPSERSSSPDSEYRAPRATFHQSLDSLDADASSGPDTFERVQSLEELDYQQSSRRYPASSSSAEILNDTDREDSGIHTAEASCSVSQADEPIEEEGNAAEKHQHVQPAIVEEKTEFRDTIETMLVESSKNLERVEEKIAGLTLDAEPRSAVLTETASPFTLVFSSSSSSSSAPASSPRPIVYQSPRVPPRRSPPEVTKPSHLPVLSAASEPARDDSLSESLSTPDSSSTNTICSLNFSAEPEFRNLQTVSSGSISPASPDSKLSSPLPSPRSPSKIPTPLPRKSLPTSPTSPLSAGSPGSPKFPLPPSPAKPARSLLPRGCQPPSEIPVPVKPASSPPASFPPSPVSPTRSSLATSLSPDPRRRTVVEVCEKVVVSPGQALVTPFITVERLEASSTAASDEVRVDEQLSSAYKKS